MSSAQFFPCNFVGTDSNTQKSDLQQQQFNFLLQAILFMKARNAMETNVADEMNRPQLSSAQYLSTIFQPILKDQQAIPIHLKILLERIVEQFDSVEVQRALREAGWTMEDLKRGYILVVRLT